MADRQPIEPDDKDVRKRAAQPLDYYVPPRPPPAVPVPLWMAPVVAGECLLLLFLLLISIDAMRGGSRGVSQPVLVGLICAGCAIRLATGMHFGITKGSRSANYGLVVLMLCFSSLGVVMALMAPSFNDPVPILLAVSALGMAIGHFCLARQPADG